MARRYKPAGSRIPVCALCKVQYHGGYWDEHQESETHKAAVGREVARLRARIEQQANRGQPRRDARAGGRLP